MDEGADSMVYNAQLDAFTLYHIVQDTPNHYPDHSFGRDGSVGPGLPALGHAMAGSLATAATKLLLYPLDLVICRLQVQNGDDDSNTNSTDDAGVLTAAKKIYAEEGGVKGFYTGCPPDIFKGLVDSFVFFLSYTLLRQIELKKVNAKNLSVPRELAVGIGAGAFAKMITTPIQNVVTRQQTAALSSKGEKGGKPAMGVKDIAKRIYAEKGLEGFWAGYSMAAFLTLNPAITFAVDNALKGLLPKSKREKPPPQLTFLMAAFSKVVATAITYPVMLAKSRAMAGSSKPSSGTPSEKQPNDPSLKAKLQRSAHTAASLLTSQYALYIALRGIYRKEGFAGLYSGLQVEVVKGFLSHGMTMMVKDRAHVGVIQAYYLMLKATKKWPERVKWAEESARAAAGKMQDAVEDVGSAVADGAKDIVN